MNRLATVGITVIAAATVFSAATLILLRPAHPHDAPKGWAYDTACCSGVDCREAKVTESKVGFTVQSGEVIPYSDARIRRSRDEYFHWCSEGGRDDGRTICLYVPDRGM